MHRSRNAITPIVALAWALAPTIAFSQGAAEGDATQSSSLSGSSAPILRTEIDLTYEYRFRSSEALVEPYDGKSGIDLMRNFFEVPPFARFGLDIGWGEGLSAGFGVEARREFSRSHDDGYFQPDNVPALGRPDNPFAAEKAAIIRGVLSWRSPGLDLSIGRDKLDYGEGLKGSLLPSARLPYFDALKVRGEIGALRLDWMVSSIDAIKSWEPDVDPNWTMDTAAGALTPGDPYYSLSEKVYGFDVDEHPTAILELLHRATWDFGNLKVGLSENCVIARRDNRFIVTDYLPLMSWHQASVLPNNTTLYLQVAWTPSPGLRILFEGGFDDINAEIFGVGDSDVPTIDAYVLGCGYEGETRVGAFDIYSELGYTHYLWGNFSAYRQSSIRDVDPLARAQYRFLLNTGAALLPLTSPYGPGALWFLGSGGIELAETGLRLGADILLLGKNVDANLVDTPYDKTAEDGHRAFFASLKLPARYRTGALDFSIVPAVLVREGTWWFEGTFSLSYRFSRATELGD